VGRSVLGIILGYGAVRALAVMANAVVFHGGAPEGPPELALQVVLLGMNGLAAIVGGYVAAAVGRRNPLAHGVALGAILVAVAVVMSLSGLTNSGASSEPRWFSLSVMGVSMLGATMGGLARSQMVERVPGEASQGD